MTRPPGARVLIVSPNFPPTNTPDMQRVRMSLRYFGEFGWHPHVLAVAPSGHEPIEPLLARTVPRDVSVERVRSIPLAWSRAFGVGNVALRALPFLYAAGSRLIAKEHIDLVYFSTTMFLAMPLGRLWRRRFGVPYVLDIQDPWLSDYYETHPDAAPPPKYSLARRLHAVLEPWTMRDVGGIVAVSDAYIDTLRRRYPWIAEEACATIPFAASRADFDLLDSHPQPNRLFTRADATLNGVYLGRGGDDMSPALRMLFGALAAGRRSAPELFQLIKLYFVGTDYAPDDRARKTVEPIAAEFGLAGCVQEQTARVPYFQALQMMRDADFLVLVGSDDPAYTASKVYPYLLARKPVVAVAHERSSMVPVLSAARGIVVATLPNETASDSGRQHPNSPAWAMERLVADWQRVLERPPDAREMDLSSNWAWSAREMTRRQCTLFDGVIRRARAA